ncbi:preprotein translocase subunit SecD [Halobacteriales archaeon QS_3_64_16]|nr:MAG: preprotein translocase subunit SecD [Halobacteriales archaeon QS_3_64_16]
MSRLRENWRIVLLVVLIVASAVSLFAPAVGAGGGGANATNGTDATDTSAQNESGLTNLRYGLELSGGTRVRAPLVGLTAEEVPVAANNSTNVTNTLTERLGIPPTDIQIRQRGQRSADVEVFAENVSQQEFARALRAAGVQASPDDIREGVTDETIGTAVDVLDSKVSQAGLSGATVQTVQSGQQTYIQVEVPNANRSEVLDLIGDRGQVRLVAHFPTRQNGSTVYRNETVLTQEELASIGTVQTERGQPRVPITLTDGAAEPFARSMERFGFTQNPSSCRYQQNPEDAGYCLYTVTDGEVVYGAGVRASLAQDFASGAFARDPSFVITASNVSEANQLQIDLQAGALPTELDIEDEGTTQFILPSLGDRFKLYSLLTGIVAVLAVSLVVYIRYREARIALPMIVTAFSEVFLLLGFAAAIGYPLDLSVIAGFIAVIGTGVDDLIIIADEVLQQGETSTRKMFRRRFRKAFWPIAAAAGTLIVAMAPLSVLSLGDLQGFAIVTIVGVLIGILVTRPAYGDVLRSLMTR